MTDTTTTDTPADDWLARAEAERDQREQALLTGRLDTARALAQEINNALDALGIKPWTPAAAIEEDAALVPAFLVYADPARKLYAVHATWDEDEGRPLLLLGDWNRTNGYTGLRPGRLLRDLTDVAYARREGPTVHRPSNDLRAVAARGIRRHANPNAQPDVERIVHAIGCLTAAVLHLADCTGPT